MYTYKNVDIPGVSKKWKSNLNCKIIVLNDVTYEKTLWELIIESISNRLREKVTKNIIINMSRF